MEAASPAVTSNAPTVILQGRIVARNAVMGNTGPDGDGSHPMRNDSRKYNVLVYGLEEFKEGTPRLAGQHEDMDKVVGLLRGIDESLSSTSLHKGSPQAW